MPAGSLPRTAAFATILIASCAPATALAQAGDGAAQPAAPAEPAAVAEVPAWSFGIGLKAWVTRWATWQIGNAVIGSDAVSLVSQLESPTRVAWVPVLAVRRGPWFATSSVMTRTRYRLASPTQQLTATRDEFDLSLGRDVAPGISASLGIKRIAQEAGGRYLWSGPVAAMLANAPLGEAWSMYGSFGLGRLSLRLPVADPAGRRNLPAQYTLGEWGLAWRRPGGEGGAAPSRPVFTVGYRFQVVRTPDYALEVRNEATGALRLQHETLRDVTEGLTLTWATSY